MRIKKRANFFNTLVVMNIATRENGRESKIREQVKIRNLPLPIAFHLTRRWRFLSKLSYFALSIIPEENFVPN